MIFPILGRGVERSVPGCWGCTGSWLVILGEVWPGRGTEGAGCRGQLGLLHTDLLFGLLQLQHGKGDSRGDVERKVKGRDRLGPFKRRQVEAGRSIAWTHLVPQVLLALARDWVAAHSQGHL